MSYEHGISIIEKEGPKPVQSVSTTQVVVGTAPVHLLKDPMSAVNKPIVAYTLADVEANLGYSENFAEYTLSEAVYASFYLMKVAPVVFINVLNPAIHKKDVASESVSLVKGRAVIHVDGVLLDSVVAKGTDGTLTLEKGVDYTISFDAAGKPIIAALPSGKIASASSITVSYTKLDPSMVTSADIIGGYDSETGLYSGLELIRQVFPRFGLLPSIISAPGWSHNPDVAAILNVKTLKINGNFNAFAVLDIDSSQVKKYEDVPAWKDEHNYSGERSMALWPKVKVEQKIMWYSSIFSASMARTDTDNENVPSISPSNKLIPINATVLPDGTELFLDQVQANYLNGSGIVTAMNWGGWRTWGNNTSLFPNTTEANDRFISVRRVLDWWANTFILAYFEQVDDNTNYRLIESVVDAENLRANGYIARGHISGASIEFRPDLNPPEAILNGHITFTQKIGAFTPAENIVNIIEFDPTITYESIIGGGQG